MGNLPDVYYHELPIEEQQTVDVFIQQQRNADAVDKYSAKAKACYSCCKKKKDGVLFFNTMLAKCDNCGKKEIIFKRKRDKSYYKPKAEQCFANHGINLAKLQQDELVNYDNDKSEFKTQLRRLHWDIDRQKYTWRGYKGKTKEKLGELYSPLNYDGKADTLYVMAGEWDMFKAYLDGLCCTSSLWGEGYVFGQFPNTIEILNKFKEIVLVYDQDEDGKGQKFAADIMEELSKKLGSDTKILNVELPFGDGSQGKDYCDWRKNNSFEDFLKLRPKKTPPKVPASKPAKKSNESKNSNTNDNLESMGEEKEHSLPKSLHPFFTEYLDSMHNCTDAPREYIACSLLSSLAAAIGNKAYINLGGSRLCPNLYVVLIGDSTFMRKSTSQKMGTRALKVIDNELKKNYVKQERKYIEDYEAWKNTPKKERSDNPPLKTHEDKSIIYPNEVTPEKLLEKMESRPDGIFIFSELGSLLSRMNKDMGLKEMMTDLYDFNETYTKETKTAGTNRIENACLNLLGASTIVWLQKWLKEEDLMSGFLGRFCFCIRRKYPEGNPLPDPWKCDDETIEIMQRLHSFPFHELQLSPEAKKAYIDWYKSFDNTAKQQDRLLHSFLGRLEATCHKIAIIHHCLDYCANHWNGKVDTGGIWHKEVNTISAKSYEYAFDWIKFFANNIYSCYRDIITDTSIERRVIKVTQEKGENGRIPLSKLMRYANLKSKKETMEILENLEAKNYGKIENSKKYTYFRVKTEK